MRRKRRHTGWHNNYGFDFASLREAQLKALKRQHAFSATINRIIYAPLGLMVFLLIPFAWLGLEQVGGPDLFGYLMYEVGDPEKLSASESQRVTPLALFLLAGFVIVGLLFGVRRHYKPMIEEQT